MKKLLLYPITCLTLAFGATQAQAQSDSPITIGPKLGLAYTWIGYDGEDAPDNQNGRIGLQAGGFITYSTESLLGFTAEVMYSGKGTSYDVGSLKIRQNLHYVDIPLMARIFFNHTGALRPNLFIGPSLNFLVKAEGDVSNGTNNNTQLEDFTKDCNSFEFGGVAGLGLNIKTMGTQWLNFDVRYNMGFTNYNKTADGVDLDGRNNGVVLSVGYGFGL